MNIKALFTMIVGKSYFREVGTLFKAKTFVGVMGDPITPSYLNIIFKPQISIYLMSSFLPVSTFA